MNGARTALGYFIAFCFLTSCASSTSSGRFAQPGKAISGYGRTYQAADVRRALVHVQVWTSDHAEPQSGTAFIVSVFEGTAHLLTAHHVVRPKEGEIRIRIEGDGIETLDIKSWDERLVAEDEEQDLALFTATAKPNAVAVVLQHPQAHPGSLRNTGSFGFAKAGGDGQRPTITEISGQLDWNERNGARLLSTSANLKPGMSGGPVLSYRTKAVIGVVRGGITTDASEKLVTPVSQFEEPLRVHAGIKLIRQVTPYQLPRSLPYLVRRPEEEAKLHELLNQSPPPFIVITGDGGTGKTVLATTIAYDRLDPSASIHGQGYPDGIYFIEVKGLAENDVLGRLYTAVTGQKPPTSLPDELEQEVRSLFADSSRLRRGTLSMSASTR